MNGPEFRFMYMISILLVGWWAWDITSTYLIGEKGLNIDYYIRGIFIIGTAALSGFGFVWIAKQFINFQQFKKSDFSKVTVDESGTRFDMELSLGKFRPEIITLPRGKGITPLESELMGFLLGFQHFPYDLKSPPPSGKSLYTHALALWKIVAAQPHATPLHRAAALAQDLSKICVYEEKRAISSPFKFWQRDKITFSQIAEEHGGFSAFILSTMRSFRDLKDAEKRALLTSVRYARDPISIPQNCDPLSKDVYDSLTQANFALQESEAGDSARNGYNPTPSEIERFRTELLDYFQTIVRETPLNPTDLNSHSAGVYMGNGVVIMRISAFAQQLANFVHPDIKAAFLLWQIAEEKHPIWDHIIHYLREANLIEVAWEEVTPHKSIFQFSVSGVPLKDCIILKIEKQRYPELYRYLEQLPELRGIIEIQQDLNAIVKEVQAKKNQLDQLLLSEFSS